MSAKIHSELAVIKGQEVMLFSVMRGTNVDGSGAKVEISMRRLGFPDDDAIKLSAMPCQTVAEAVKRSAAAVAERCANGWTYCQNWREHSHEKMSQTALILADDVKGRRANQPRIMTLEYPEPYHLAPYIKVTTRTPADDGGGLDKKEFYFDYPSALEAKRGAKSRIDAACLAGYRIAENIMADDGGMGAKQAVAEALKKSPILKLLLDKPPEADDWGPLVMAIEPRPLTGEVAIRFCVRHFMKSDSRLEEALRRKQPIPMANLGKGQGVFYPTNLAYEQSESGNTKIMLATGALVGGKLVGGATMAPMEIKRSFSELLAKPEEPKAIRHIELE